MTGVRIEFEMDSLDALIDTCIEEFGSQFFSGNTFLSEGNFSTLSDTVLRDKVVFRRHW